MCRDAGSARLFDMNQISSKVLVPAAILAGVCSLVANSLYEDTVGDGDQILAEAAGGVPLAGQLSVALFLLGFVRPHRCPGHLVRGDRQAYADPCGGGGRRGCRGGGGPAGRGADGIALREAADVVDPGTAEVLVGMDKAGFTVFGFLISLALGAAALGLLRYGGSVRGCDPRP
jgi:hypothetical protein